MKKFKFRLQKVLEYRETNKSEKRRVLLVKNQELQAGKNRLVELENMALSNKLEQGTIMMVQQVEIWGMFAERIKDEIAMQKLNLIKLEEEVAAALKEYIDASKDARSLELLKERKLQEFWDVVHKEDEKFLDELAVQRYKLQ